MRAARAPGPPRPPHLASTAVIVAIGAVALVACGAPTATDDGSSLSAVVSHRTAAIVCGNGPDDAGVVPTPGAPTGSKTADPTGPTGAAITCVNDVDCPPCANGQIVRCLPTLPAITLPWSCVCDQCSRDADCAADEACLCRDPKAPFSFAVCAPGTCRADADCGPGNLCSPTPSFLCGGSVSGYACHTGRDTCHTDADCAVGTCRYSPDARSWTCGTGTCEP